MLMEACWLLLLATRMRMEILITRQIRYSSGKQVKLKSNPSRADDAACWSHVEASWDCAVATGVLAAAECLLAVQSSLIRIPICGALLCLDGNVLYGRGLSPVNAC